MFGPYEPIIKQLLLDRNPRTAWAPRQYIYMLSLHVVIIEERTPAFHSRHFLVAASMLCSIVRRVSLEFMSSFIAYFLSNYLVFTLFFLHIFLLFS
jgi:hypothetical protein